jgi:hypothetical protein
MKIPYQLHAYPKRMGGHLDNEFDSDNPKTWIDPSSGMPSRPMYLHYGSGVVQFYHKSWSQVNKEAVEILMNVVRLEKLECV